MELHVQQLATLPSFVHDGSATIVVGIAMIAGLVFIILGRLLHGLLTGAGGCVGKRRGGHLELGPAEAAAIEEPARRHAPSPGPQSRARQVMRPHLWHYLSGT